MIRNVTGTEQVHKVWDIVTTCIRHSLSYDMIMCSIYLVYTSIYQAYSCYMISYCHLAGFRARIQARADPPQRDMPDDHLPDPDDTAECRLRVA